METYATNGCALELKQYMEFDIKRAFWKTFYGAGEIFFRYGEEESTESKNESVELRWNEFLENLEERE